MSLGFDDLLRRVNGIAQEYEQLIKQKHKPTQGPRRLLSVLFDPLYTPGKVGKKRFETLFVPLVSSKLCHLQQSIEDNKVNKHEAASLLASWLCLFLSAAEAECLGAGRLYNRVDALIQEALGLSFNPDLSVSVYEIDNQRREYEVLCRTKRQEIIIHNYAVDLRLNLPRQSYLTPSKIVLKFSDILDSYKKSSEPSPSRSRIFSLLFNPGQAPRGAVGEQRFKRFEDVRRKISSYNNSILVLRYLITTLLAETAAGRSRLYRCVHAFIVEMLNGESMQLFMQRTAGIEKLPAYTATEDPPPAYIRT